MPNDNQTSCPAAPIAPAAVSEPVWIDCPMCGTRFADATGTAHDLSLRKPSAEGDGWIAVTDAAKIVCQMCRDDVPLERGKGGIFHNPTTPTVRDSWPYRCHAEAIRLAALPAPPSGQGEKR